MFVHRIHQHGDVGRRRELRDAVTQIEDMSAARTVGLDDAPGFVRNIFRRGDQSNVLVLDRHTEIYRLASATDKTRLSNQADGVNVRPARPLRCFA